MQKAIQSNLSRTACNTDAVPAMPGLTTKAKLLADLAQENKSLVAHLLGTLSYNCLGEPEGLPKSTGELLQSLDYAKVILEETNQRLQQLVNEVQN